MQDLKAGIQSRVARFGLFQSSFGIKLAHFSILIQRVNPVLRRPYTHRNSHTIYRISRKLLNVGGHLTAKVGGASVASRTKHCQVSWLQFSREIVCSQCVCRLLAIITGQSITGHHSVSISRLYTSMTAADFYR